SAAEDTSIQNHGTVNTGVTVSEESAIGSPTEFWIGNGVRVSRTTIWTCSPTSSVLISPVTASRTCASFTRWRVMASYLRGDVEGAAHARDQDALSRISAPFSCAADHAREMFGAVAISETLPVDDTTPVAVNGLPAIVSTRPIMGIRVPAGGLSSSWRVTSPTTGPADPSIAPRASEAIVEAPGPRVTTRVRSRSGPTRSMRHELCRCHPEEADAVAARPVSTTLSRYSSTHCAETPTMSRR